MTGGSLYQMQQRLCAEEMLGNVSAYSTEWRNDDDDVHEDDGDQRDDNDDADNDDDDGRC